MIELAIGLVILGVIIAIAVPVIFNTQLAARRANAESTAADVHHMISIELTLKSSADTTQGTLGDNIGKLRDHFVLEFPGSTLTVEPAVIGTGYCVKANVPGFGTAAAGTECARQGWLSE